MKRVSAAEFEGLVGELVRQVDMRAFGTPETVKQKLTAAFQAEREHSVAMLQKYGVHEDECRISLFESWAIEGSPRECTCGLNDLLKGESK